MKDRNADRIRQAFSKFSSEKDEVIRAGMYGLLEDAVRIALDAHDDRHQAHLEIGDTYGWMLVHDGAIEDITVVSTDRNEGKTLEMLKKKLSEVPKTGWVGVVMAGLTPNYFAVVYEMGMLDYARQESRDNFGKYFRKL